MALDRERIVAAALAMLRDDGLGGLSMRRLAHELDVNPNALYWHVPNKQELLVAVAREVVVGVRPARDPYTVARSLRRALLAVRDGAEVVSFAYAWRPGDLPVVAALRRAIGLAADDEHAHLVATVVIEYVLGAVAVEQNRAELRRAGIAEGGPDTADATFAYGLRALLAVSAVGLASRS